MCSLKMCRSSRHRSGLLARLGGASQTGYSTRELYCARMVEGCTAKAHFNVDLGKLKDFGRGRVAKCHD